MYRDFYYSKILLVCRKLLFFVPINQKNWLKNNNEKNWSLLEYYVVLLCLRERRYLCEKSCLAKKKGIGLIFRMVGSRNKVDSSSISMITNLYRINNIGHCTTPPLSNILISKTLILISEIIWSWPPFFCLHPEFIVLYWYLILKLSLFVYICCFLINFSDTFCDNMWNWYKQPSKLGSEGVAFISTCFQVQAQALHCWETKHS